MLYQLLRFLCESIELTQPRRHTGAIYPRCITRWIVSQIAQIDTRYLVPGTRYQVQEVRGHIWARMRRERLWIFIQYPRVLTR